MFFISVFSLGFVDCSTVETNYYVEDEHRLCVNCSHCESKNNNTKYAIEFCLPNKVIIYYISSLLNERS